MLFGTSFLFILSTLILNTAYSTSLPVSISPRKILQLPYQILSSGPILKEYQETLTDADPKDHSDQSLEGLPIEFREHFAPYANGDLLLLAHPISAIYQKIKNNPSHSATISINDELGSIQRNSSLWASNRRRVSLFGTVHPVVDKQAAKALYEGFHPDNSLWNGDDDPPHQHLWIRFKVEKVFYFGGFGDRAAFGWLDKNIYQTGFQESAESRARSVCFHPYGQNLYCEQSDERLKNEAENSNNEGGGPDSQEEMIFEEYEKEEIDGEDDGKADIGDYDEEEVDREGDHLFDFGDDELNNGGTESDGEAEFEDVVEEFWIDYEQEPQPSIFQIVNNVYHYHHHHSSIDGEVLEEEPLEVNGIIETVVDKIQDHLMELVDGTTEKIETDNIDDNSTPEEALDSVLHTLSDRESIEAFEGIRGEKEGETYNYEENSEDNFGSMPIAPSEQLFRTF